MRRRQQAKSPRGRRGLFSVPDVGTMKGVILSANVARSKSLNLTTDRPIAERFSKVERVWDRCDRRWILRASVDGTVVKLPGKQLFDYREVRAAALEQSGLYLPRVSEEEWEELVKLRVEEAGGEWTV